MRPAIIPVIIRSSPDNKSARSYVTPGAFVYSLDRNAVVAARLY